MLITTLQLTQMVFGIAVTVSSVVYLSRGLPCYVSLFNSLLGLGMYASYFVLFLQLFLSHYVYRATKKKPTNIAVGQASVATMGGKPSPSSSPIMSSTPGKPLKAD